MTSLARTVVDVAATRTFVEAVVVADAALRIAGRVRAGFVDVVAVEELRTELRRELAALGAARGAARARRAVEFARPEAQLPGESVSRCTMLFMGCPTPELQHRLVAHDGSVYYLDFYWPGQRIGGEFDGRSKYEDARYTRGRSAAEVVDAEKRREDDIRLELAGYGRWGFDVAPHQSLLSARLRRTGLRW